MSKITLSNIANLTDTTTAQTTINNNNAALTTAINNTISRDGSLPNAMAASLDMNLYQVLNLPAPATALSPLRLQDLTSFIGGGTVTNIPIGGTTGQVLAKTSNVDYAVNWSNSVTSVGLTLPADFTVTNSPVTTAGVLTAAYVTPPTGTGALVRATTPTLVTPILGAATGTSLNLSGLTASSAVATDGSKNLVSITNTGTGNNVLATSPTLTTPVLGVASTTSLAITGTAGAGFIEYPTEASAPSAPATGFRMYADSSGRKSWIRASDGFTRTWDAVLTGNRVYTFQDSSDTIIGRATTDILTNKTFDTAGAGNVFKINGTQLSAVTGTGSAVLSASPTLTGTALAAAITASGVVTAGTLTSTGDLNGAGDFFITKASSVLSNNLIATSGQVQVTYSGNGGVLYLFKDTNAGVNQKYFELLTTNGSSGFKDLTDAGAAQHTFLTFSHATGNSTFSNDVGFGTTALTSSLIAIAAGTTTLAQINFAGSTAPTSPNNGDFWFDGTNVKIRVAGVTKTFTLT